MLDDALKKIKIQIKFGRAVEAKKSLRGLLETASPEDRIRILPIFADISFETGRYEDAAMAIRECLQFELSDELKSDLRKKLTISEERLSIVPSEPDHNTPELNSFLDSIENFLTEKSSAKHQFIELNDPEEVRRCAHDQNIPSPFYSWNAARTSASKETMSYVFRNKLNLDAFEEKYVDQIYKICEDVLPDGSRGAYYFDDIYADLSLIARGLLIKQPNFLLAKMKAAYEISLFPCGWRGPFPEGELIVYKLW